MSTTSSTQTILPTPLRSLLRKMSTNTVIANQIQMIQKKKTKNDQKTWPSPKAASTGSPLVCTFRVGLPRGQGKARTDPHAVWHGARPGARLLRAVVGHAAMRTTRHGPAARGQRKNSVST